MAAGSCASEEVEPNGTSDPAVDVDGTDVSDDEDDGATGPDGAEGGEIALSEADFPCMGDLVAVRNFRVGNVLGDVDSSVAVAEGEAPLPYPTGTLLQLVPFEAMVKREPGFSETSADWEFFFFDLNRRGVEIRMRGDSGVVNQFGGDCLSCHNAARDFDFVCEQDHGCDPLPITEEALQLFLDTDPRCD